LVRISDPAETIVLEMEESVLFKSDAVPEPDPDWKFEDPAGHVHQWRFLRPEFAATDPEGASPSLPSLRYVADSDGAHYQCKECGWPTEPGKRPKGAGRFRPSQRVYRLNGQRINEDGAKLAFAIIRALNENTGEISTADDTEALPEPAVFGDDKG
jgi:hypothetical protein